MDLSRHIPPQIYALRREFARDGFDIRPIGGFSRDLLLGESPKDLDLSTDATPEEQVAIYDRAGIRWVAPGWDYGTVMAIIEGVGYEITSLRRESAHDGRRAVMHYTRDWREDHGRRDLTINQIGFTLDGDVVDFHDGVGDLKARRVRFVGDASERMREDFLRILRFVRFHARFAGDAPFDPEAETAIRRHAEGLRIISAERIWSEMARTVVLPHGWAMLDRIAGLGLRDPMRLPEGSPERLREALRRQLRKAALGLGSPEKALIPALLMTAYLSDPQAIDADEAVARVEHLAQAWRWSNAERNLGVFIARHAGNVKVDLKRLVALDGAPVDRVIDLAILQGRMEEAVEIHGWAVPAFPVDGDDLRRAGWTPGPAMGAHLVSLREAWAASGYAMTKDELLGAREPAAGPRV